MDFVTEPDLTGAVVPARLVGTDWYRVGRTILDRGGIFVVVVLVCVLGTFVSAEFLRKDNIDVIITQTVPLALVALGQTFVIFTGNIDLSVGSLLSLASVIVGETMGGSNARMVPVIVLALLFGAGVGTVNGLLVSTVRIPSFIVTLAMMLVLDGVNLVWTNAGPASNLTADFRLISEGHIGPLPSGVLTLAVGVIVAYWIAARTPLGRMFLAVGSNRRAAEISGVRIHRVVIAGFVLSGIFAAAAGVFFTAYVGESQSFVGKGMELSAIAAAVLGGTSLFGGRGSVVGSVGGALLLTIVYDLLILAGLSPPYQQISTGVILIAGTLMYVRARSAS